MYLGRSHRIIHGGVALPLLLLIVGGSGQTILSGTFVTNEGTRHPQTPFQLDSTTFIFGALNGGFFKMASVNANGIWIENRFTDPSVVSSIAGLTATKWANANRGGEYAVVDVVVAPARPESVP